MKIEIMEKIVNSISDSEANVSFYKEMLKNYDNLDEKIKEELEKNNYNVKIYDIATNPNVLEYRTIEEQIKLIQAFKDYNCNINVYYIAEDPNVLKYKTVEEQIKLMQALKDCDCAYYALCIATNPNVIENRTIEEQIKLMQTLKDCNYNDGVYYKAIDSDILENKTIEEQIEEMRKKICYTHVEKINEINNIDELKKYVNVLKTKLGPEQDISLEEVVPVYKKQK